VNREDKKLDIAANWAMRTLKVSHPLSRALQVLMVNFMKIDFCCDTFAFGKVLTEMEHKSARITVDDTVHHPEVLLQPRHNPQSKGMMELKLPNYKRDLKRRRLFHT